MATNPTPIVAVDDEPSDFTAEELTELERLEYEAAMADSAASAADPETAARYESQAAAAWERIATIYQAHGVNYSGDPEEGQR